MGKMQTIMSVKQKLKVLMLSIIVVVGSMSSFIRCQLKPSGVG